MFATSRLGTGKTITFFTLNLKRTYNLLSDASFIIKTRKHSAMLFLPVEFWNECGGPNDRAREDELPLEHDGWGPTVPTHTTFFRLGKTEILPKKKTFVVTFRNELGQLTAFDLTFPNLIIFSKISLGGKKLSVNL